MTRNSGCRPRQQGGPPSSAPIDARSVPRVDTPPRCLGLALLRESASTMCSMAERSPARPSQVRGAARRGRGVRAHRARPWARRRSRSARASACPAPRSATRWRRWRSSAILQHPHTSAGRIPTDLGYRHYVDSLRWAAASATAAPRDRRLLRRGHAGPRGGPEGARAADQPLTQYAGLGVPPGASDEPIVRLELIDMGPTIMVLAVGQHGRVDKRMVDRPGRGRREGAAGAPSGGSARSEAPHTPTRRPGCCSWPRRGRGRSTS